MVAVGRNQGDKDTGDLIHLTLPLVRVSGNMVFPGYCQPTKGALLSPFPPSHLEVPVVAMLAFFFF